MIGTLTWDERNERSLVLISKLFIGMLDLRPEKFPWGSNLCAKKRMAKYLHVQ